MGIPLLWIEWSIGRHGGQHGHHATPGLLDVLGKSKILKYFGVFGIFTNLIVAAYYCYIESWTLAYVWHSITGTFHNMSAQEVAQFFNNYLDKGSDSFINIPVLAIIFFLITISVNLFILSRGISKGIEAAAKVLMPILLIFGAFLAIRALTLNAGELGAVNDAIDGLNFLWQPDFTSLSDPKVWLAAAGQVFFTLSVGMGSILCYAAYLRETDDVALNAATAGFMNEFVEVVLGGSIIIPIAVAYLGFPFLEAIQGGEVGGFEITFVTMPTLFHNWGPVLASIAGILWFGLLFFAGITSSLSMGQPLMAFLQDSFGFTRKKSTFIFGLTIFLLAIPCILFYELGAFDEYDYWAGTFSLVVFALGESIIFVWVFGIDNAWNEINKGADIKIPYFFRYILKYVTPLFLLVVFIGALITPEHNDWSGAINGLFSGEGWPLGADSVIGKIFNVGVEKTEKIWVGNAVRFLMLLTYAAIAAMIAYAWKLKAREDSEGGNS